MHGRRRGRGATLVSGGDHSHVTHVPGSTEWLMAECKLQLYAPRAPPVIYFHGFSLQISPCQVVHLRWK